MQKKIFITVALCISICTVKAQEIPDSLAQDFRNFLAKNFSMYRTVNLNWETKWAHNYTFTQDGNELEKGKRPDLHKISFSTMIPVLKLKKVSLYANVQYRSYQFDAIEKNHSATSAIFSQDGYDYFAGGLNGTYYINVFNKPLALSASVIADGWDKGFGKVQGLLSAVMIFKHTKTTTFTAGIMGMTLFSSIPIMPVISYWHRFNNPNLSVDITMPSQFYMRYQLNSHRFSAGASMTSDNFYMKPNLKNVPDICYFSEATLNPEIVYEYIINKHFYLVARAGASMVMMAGLYSDTRKGIKVRNEEGQTEVEPLVKMKRNMVPFFNLGVSYSLFK